MTFTAETAQTRQTNGPTHSFDELHDEVMLSRPLNTLDARISLHTLLCYIIRTMI